MSRASLAALFVLVVFAFASGGGAMFAQQPGGNPEMKKVKNPVKPTAASIAAGKTVFDKYCRFCHGDDAKGDGPLAPKDSHPSNLTDDTWTRGSSDGEIFGVIRDGAGPKFDMKGFKTRLMEQDMWNVINYLRSLNPHTAKKAK
jgi:mono/diheme cytochrome c family protein